MNVAPGPVDRTPAADAAAGVLAEGMIAALPVWVERSVERLVEAWTQQPPAAEVQTAAARAGEEAAADLGPRIRQLLAADFDHQRTTPLALLREAVAYPTAVLRDAGVPGVERDRFAEEAFPDDVYNLTPATFADLDPALAEPGLVWGAAKAMDHRNRHRGDPQ